jgi:hypothetical protein
VRRYAPSAVGYEHGLYALDGYDPEMRDALERDYMAPLVDEPASKALRALMECNKEKLTPELRNAWTQFLISLMIRTPHMIAEITGQAEQHLRHNLLKNPEEYEAVRKDGDPATMLEWAEKNVQPVFKSVGKTLLPELAGNEKIGTAIIRMEWFTVLFAQDAGDLLTCDNPCYMTHGLGDERCLVVLPISPHAVFFEVRREPFEICFTARLIHEA